VVLCHYIVCPDEVSSSCTLFDGFYEVLVNCKALIKERFNVDQSFDSLIHHNWVAHTKFHCVAHVTAVLSARILPLHVE
jgi:hypothetical protein